jgi:hypothetical protein
MSSADLSAAAALTDAPFLALLTHSMQSCLHELSIGDKRATTQNQTENSGLYHCRVTFAVCLCSRSQPTGLVVSHSTRPLCGRVLRCYGGVVNQDGTMSLTYRIKMMRRGPVTPRAAPRQQARGQPPAAAHAPCQPPPPLTPPATHPAAALTPPWPPPARRGAPPGRRSPGRRRPRRPRQTRLRGWVGAFG